MVPRLLAVSLAALAVTGCKSLEEPGAHVAGFTLVEPSQRHPIMVSQQPSTLTLRVARGSEGLTASQRSEVAQFVSHYRSTDAGNSKLVITVPGGSPNEAAAARAVADIRSLITSYGFADSNVVIEPYHEARDSNAPIRLSYMRYVAEGPGCGLWPTNLAEDYRNLPYPNFGCAQQRNLAAQIANPADLLGPRTMETADQERRSVVFDKYRRGEPTPSTWRDDQTVQGKTTK